MRARMTIIGVESELNHKTTPDSLTNKWTFTDSELPFEPSTLLATIINQGASFCVLYTDPDYFQLMNEQWWNRWGSTFENWWKLQALEYNPIENYDRIEEWHDDIVDEGSTSSESSSETDFSGSSENQVSAYDVSTYSPHDKTTDSSGTDVSASSSGTSDNDRDVDHTGHIHGNIGVKTTQSMLEESYKLGLNWGNLYKQMSDIFCKEMLIRVY